MAIKIHSTRNISKNGIKVLVYGKSGIGKTKLLSTAPSPIILSNEEGLLSLSDFDLPYYEINSVEDLDDAYEELSKVSSRKQYKTVCLDSISEIAEVILNEYLNKEKNPLRAYGILKTEIENLTRRFKKLKNRNVIFTAKRKIIEGDEGLPQFIPRLPGKALDDFLPYQFDEVFYMTKHENDEGKKRRVLITDAGIEHDAKDRSGKLAYMEKPDLGMIFDKIISKKSKRKLKRKK